MPKIPLLATLALGLAAAACAGPYDRQAAVPRDVPSALTASERNCLDYGFAVGSSPYDRCVQRDARARLSGRVNRDYAEARLFEDARDACYDYGLARGSQRYDSCVSREVDARRYRDQGQMTASPIYAPDYTTPYAEPRPASTGVQAFKDEFGFRYDSQGNRLDRNGRIVSPQTTTP
jgi:hypothetical protein